jgi:hypothetical protein
VSTVIAPTLVRAFQGRRDHRADRRRLARQDALSARLAELHSIRTVLARAAAIVGQGWIQGAWFAVSTPRGERVVTGYDLRLLRSHPVTGACLVGAVVQAGGGPGAVRSQTTQRTLDLAWHALREDPGRPVTWSPSPPVRTMQVLDLTHWNDAPHRSQDEVVDLLTVAQSTAAAERQRCLAESAALGASLPDVTAGS